MLRRLCMAKCLFVYASKTDVGETRQSMFLAQIFKKLFWVSLVNLEEQGNS
jgi:hypothetical protein